MKTQLSKPARSKARYSEDYKKEGLDYGVRVDAAQPRSKRSCRGKGDLKPLWEAL